MPAETGLEPGAAPSRAERVGSALRRWRGELAETGGPNALLWYRDTPGGTLDLTGAHPTGASMLIAGNRVRLSNLVREEGAFIEVRRTARRIREKALELREQHGLDTGYLVIGTASWDLPGTKRRPQAPIMLRTCRLHAVDPAESDLELELAPHVEINPVLIHYMAAERGIRLDGDALADVAHSTGRFDPFPVYRELTRQLVHVPGFKVTDRRVLSTFSTTKMAMVADLAAFAGLRSGHDVIAALAGDLGAARALDDDGAGGLAETAGRPTESDLTRELLVLDADPSQADVIDTARSGRHVLVDAAPGTGATQTLANVAAALVGSDQRVLVISENARQLDAFVDHLDAAGLGALVLDARDPAELRRRLPLDIVTRLETPDPDPYMRGDLRGDLHGEPGPDDSTVPTNEDPAATTTSADATTPNDVGRAVPATLVGRHPGETDEQALGRVRARLAAHRDSVHALRSPWGVSVFDAQTALARLTAGETPPTSTVRIPAEALREMSRERVLALAEQAAQAARAGAWSTESDDDDPWWGADLESADDVLRALALAAELSEGRLAEDRAALDATLAEVGLPPARTTQDWGDALRLFAAIRQTLTLFRPEVFTRPLDELASASAEQADHEADQTRPWWVRRSHKKQARALLLPHAQVSSLHGGLSGAIAQRRAWAELGGSDPDPHLPGHLDEATARWELLAGDLRWLAEALRDTPGGGDLLEAPLDQLATRLTGLAARSDRIAALPAVAPALRELREAGFTRLLDDFAARHLDAGRIADESEFVWWSSVLDAVAASDPAYGQHDGIALRGLLSAYASGERALQEAHARSILQRARAHARVEAATRPDQANLLRDAALEERHPRPLRELLAQCGDVVAATAPIWVLSPLTLATVAPTHLAFDAVLIDDAGRMPVAHSLSALARSVRVVAVGDLRGPGPVAFDTVASTEDAPQGESAPGRPDAPPLTSILGALAEHLPLRHLTRVYDDRDARIASFALDRREEAVAALPHAGRGPALRVVRTGAVLSSADDGASAGAREAARVVQLVLEHVRRTPDRSLAVVTFGAWEAARLDGALRKALRNVPEAASAPAFVDGAPERLLVCPLDRAVGYSRDTVILATGVLPRIEQAASGGDARPGGIVESVDVPSRLNQPDGALLVDVAASVARRRLDVVSAVSAGDLARIQEPAPGVARLAELLEHAESGGLATPPGTAGRHCLLGELAARLRHEGLTVHEGYGVGDERLDLAIEDPYLPGQLVVAVGSDGDRHAACPSVRERDRLVPQLLTRRGWRYVRVWSTDIFRDPARDVARVVDAVRGEEWAESAGERDGVGSAREDSGAGGSPVGGPLAGGVPADGSLADHAPVDDAVTAGP